MPFASKEDKSAYMKVWRSKNAYTDSYKKRGCEYVKKHYAWKRVAQMYRQIDPFIFEYI